MNERWTGTLATGLGHCTGHQKSATRGLRGDSFQNAALPYNLPTTSVWCHIRKCFFFWFPFSNRLGLRLAVPDGLADCAPRGFAELKNTLKWTHSVTQTDWPHDTPQSCTPSFIHICMCVCIFKNWTYEYLLSTREAELWKSLWQNTKGGKATSVLKKVFQTGWLGAGGELKTYNGHMEATN